MTVKEFLLNSYNSINEYVYVYGAKGEVVTEGLIQRLAKENPSTYTQSYIDKCRKKIGKKGIDCSGLVCRAAGISSVGSYYMKDKWKSKSKPECGLVAWKPGHVAVVYSVLESGSKIGVVEAKGVDHDVEYNIYRVDSFKCFLVVPSVEYDVQEKETTAKEGWEQDNEGRWKYKDKQGYYYKDRIVRIKWDKGKRQDYFSFDKEGYLLTSTIIKCKVDANGCIVGVKEDF